MGAGGFKSKARVVPSPQSVIPAPHQPAVIRPRSSVVSRASGSGDLVNYPDRSTYRGQLRDGLRHGHGTLTLENGTVYECEWRDDKRWGSGTETFPDGTRFTGIYENDMRTGDGVMLWPEGSQYSGQFQHGKANGEGCLLRTDGSVYKGQFRDDFMQGSGCMQWNEDGVHYVGQFVANMREGTGTMTWKSGKWKSYEGKWQDGMQHGRGALTDHNGETSTGVFHWGKLQSWDDATRLEAQPNFSVPTYWTHQDLSSGFDERKEVPAEFQRQIQKLLDGTFRGIRTRDRQGRIPSRLRLIKCHRVENAEMWKRYFKGKERILARRQEGVRPVNELNGDKEVGFVRTQELLTESFAKELDRRVNEHLLWHGTTPDGAFGISSGGFKLSYAGTHAGTYFGRGCYFAESSSKADEYAQEGDGLLTGIHALLLCRVTCGALFRTMNPDKVAIREALASGDHDGVLGDREACVGSYREFVIYEEDLVYPEYVILYERQYDT